MGTDKRPTLGWGDLDKDGVELIRDDDFQWEGTSSYEGNESPVVLIHALEQPNSRPVTVKLTEALANAVRQAGWPKPGDRFWLGKRGNRAAAKHLGKVPGFEPKKDAGGSGGQPSGVSRKASKIKGSDYGHRYDKYSKPVLFRDQAIAMAQAGVDEGRGLALLLLAGTEVEKALSDDDPAVRAAAVTVYGETLKAYGMHLSMRFEACGIPGEFGEPAEDLEGLWSTIGETILEANLTRGDVKEYVQKVYGMTPKMLPVLTVREIAKDPAGFARRIQDWLQERGTEDES